MKTHLVKVAWAAALLACLLHLGCAQPRTSAAVLEGHEIAGQLEQGPEAAAEAALEQRFGSVPERYRAKSLENLRSYYAYDTVREWLLGTAQGAPQPELNCVAFLFAYLPPADYGALTPELLREHVQYGLKVRAEASWRGQITDELFYHYILPHRVTQEPCQAWRKLMHDELWPRVKDLPMQEAALEANRYAREYATFQSTNARDQGPLTTMLRGVGRCEEEMILYICAARSIGIPARPCSTPYWTFTDNNHAWCEAYADGRWWFLGGCEPDLELDRGWFAGPASRAGLVVSTAYGDVAQSREPILARRNGVTLINSTPVYSDTCEVSIDCELPVSGDVYVHIFNFGSLRTISRFAPGGSIVLGRGDFVLTGQTAQGPVAALARTWDDKAATPDVLEKARARLSREGWKQYVLGMTLPTAGDEPGPVDAHNWLRFPNAARKSTGRGIAGAPHAAPLQAQLTLEQKQALAKASGERQRARDQWRRERSKLRPEDEKLIEGLPGDYPARARKQLARCGANTPEITAAMATLPEQSRHHVVDILELGDDKDCFEWTAQSLCAFISSRTRAPDVSLEDWREWVLAPRVRNESSNQRGLAQAFKFTFAGDRVHLPAAICKAVNARLSRADRTYFGSPANALEAERAGRANAEDASVALVQAYRDWGFPARLASSAQWAEVYAGQEWLPVYPFESESFGKVKPEAAALYARPGRVQCQFTRDQGDFPDAEPWRDFMLCRVEKGYIEPQEQLEWKNGACEVPPGDYVLFTGARSGRGDVCFRSVQVRVESGQTARVKADCSLVREELDAVELTARKLKAWPQARLTSSGGKLVSLQEIVGERPTLVLLLNTNDEPARRLLALMAPMQAELAQRGISLAAIYVGAEGRDEWEQRATEAGVSISIFDDPEKALFTEIGAGIQPALLLITPGCETLLWQEGFTLHAPQLIKGALKWVK